MSYRFTVLVATLFVLIVFSAHLILPFVSAQDVRLTAVTVQVDPLYQNYSGHCPVPVTIHARLDATGNLGVVRYQFVHTDGTPSEVVSALLSFNEAPRTYQFEVHQDLLKSANWNDFVYLRVFLPGPRDPTFTDSNHIRTAGICAPLPLCTTDLECSDGVWCNGRERCIPGMAGADSRGCHAATEPTCRVGQTCDETRGTCMTDCPVQRDADGDMHVAARCGGDDCDDHDRNRYGGNIEVCDAEGHDEDCNPWTYGHRDLDGDGEDDNRCCNHEANGTFHCGTDYDDNNPAIRLGSMICDGADAVVVFLPGPSFRPCPTGTNCVVQPNSTGICMVPPAGYVPPGRFVPPPPPPGLPSLSTLLFSFANMAGLTSAEQRADSSLFVAPRVGSAATDSAGGLAAEVAVCRSTLQSGKVSWGGGTTWSSSNIDKLCNGTRNAKNTIACFQSNVEKLGWAAAIDTCK